jgi:hypothetical protein
MDFYGTTAQVIPVLLLALIWESGYLDRLKKQDRSNYKFWKKSRVRKWGIFMAVSALSAEAAMMLVLADVIDEGTIPRWIGLVGLGVLIGSLVVRLITDVLDATREVEAVPVQEDRRPRCGGG